MLRGATGFDSRGQIASVVPAETRLPQRTQQIPQCLEAQKVQTLVRNFELALRLRFSYLTAKTRLPGWIVRLFYGDIVFLLQSLNQLLDQLVERTLFLHAFELFPKLLIDRVLIHQSLFDHLTKFVQSLVAIRQLVPAVVLKSALQQVVGQGAEQVFHAHFTGGIGNVLAISDALHNLGPQLPLTSLCVESIDPSTGSVVWTPSPEGRLFPVEVFLLMLRLLFSCRKHTFFAAPDALMGIQPFQDELGS